MTDCGICAHIAGDPSRDLIHRELGDTSYVRRVVDESETFVVLPSLGPLAPGHCLLSPKRHLRSFAQLDSDSLEEVERWKVALRTNLAGLYLAPVHCFEHGNGSDSGRVACSVEHAHQHFVPAKVNLLAKANSVLGNFETLEPGETLDAIAGDKEYLLYEAPSGRRMIWLSDGQEIPSQLMRREFAAALGHPGKWNWRLEHNAAAANATFRRLAGAFA